MTNPLVQTIEEELRQLGLRKWELVHESYSPEHFGNAQAIYRVGNLYLNFVRDRGNDLIDLIGAKLTTQKDSYNFDDVSLLMDWESLDEMVKKYKYTNIDFSKPPPGPVPLGDALRLIKQHYERLQSMFSPAEVKSTLETLKGIAKKRSQALFGR